MRPTFCLSSRPTSSKQNQSQKSLHHLEGCRQGRWNLHLLQNQIRPDRLDKVGPKSGAGYGCQGYGCWSCPLLVLANDGGDDDDDDDNHDDDYDDDDDDYNDDEDADDDGDDDDDEDSRVRS